MAFFVLGAGIGASARYVIDSQFRLRFKFPFGILLVNVLGSFLLGLFAESTTIISFMVVGFCGAFTTWSAFILDITDALQSKRFTSGAQNVLLSLLLSLFAGWVGSAVSPVVRPSMLQYRQDDEAAPH